MLINKKFLIVLLFCSFISMCTSSFLIIRLGTVQEEIPAQIRNEIDMIVPGGIEKSVDDIKKLRENIVFLEHIKKDVKKAVRQVDDMYTQYRNVSGRIKMLSEFIDDNKIIFTYMAQLVSNAQRTQSDKRIWFSCPKCKKLFLYSDKTRNICPSCNVASKTILKFIPHTCPKCSLSFFSENGAKQVRCPKCGKVFYDK